MRRTALSHTTPRGLEVQLLGWKEKKLALQEEGPGSHCGQGWEQDQTQAYSGQQPVPRSCPALCPWPTSPLSHQAPEPTPAKGRLLPALLTGRELCTQYRCHTPPPTPPRSCQPLSQGRWSGPLGKGRQHFPSHSPCQSHTLLSLHSQKQRTTAMPQAGWPCVLWVTSL